MPLNFRSGPPGRRAGLAAVPRVLLVLIATLIAAPTLAAQDPSTPPQESELDIEDLMNVQVTSLSRKAQALEDVPAALTVVRGEDIRRMGATSLPEALRGVPGMQVARTRSHTWAVSARGFNDNLSNKLLVLIDGRSVYSPLHSGVFWDVQDAFLDDVDRIEVIRGPGGSIWGANAINGVVNVISKSAEQTQGVLVTGGGGTEDRAFGGIRYGFQAGEDHFVRVYAKGIARDDAADGVDPDEAARDAWVLGHGGFRSDLKLGEGERLTVTGDFTAANEKERINVPSLASPTGTFVEDPLLKARGGHVLVRWERDVDATSGFAVQVYYDYYLRDQELFEDAFHTGDFDFQHRFQLMEGHRAQWGVGYRIYRSHFSGSFPFQVDPERRTDDVVSAFVQDEIALAPDLLGLTLGSKFEYNDYSGFEYQPSARLSCTPGGGPTIWASVSRAVRTPSIIDVSGRLTPLVAPPVVVSIFGSPDFQSEVLIAYEAGFRIQPVEEVAADVAAFYNRYDRLRSGEIGTPFAENTPAPPHLVVPINLENNLDGSTRGVEASVQAQVLRDVQLKASYTWLRMDLSEEPAEGRDPEHTAWLRAVVDFAPGWAFDAMGRYVSRLKTFDVDAYIEVDLRLAWRVPEKNLEIALVGQNLLHDSHPEFQDEAQRSEIERGFYASLTWGF